LSREVAFDKHELNNAKLYLTLHTWSIRASAHKVVIQGGQSNRISHLTSYRQLSEQAQEASNKDLCK